MIRIEKCRLSEALEFTVQTLFFRLKRFGKIDGQVADSHFDLGLIYRKLAEFTKSEKHLKICNSYLIFDI